MPRWTEAKWKGTDDPTILAQFTAYKCGSLWLLVYIEPFFLNCRYHYTSSRGANSENSFSGVLPPESNGLSLQEAQKAVESKVRKMTSP